MATFNVPPPENFNFSRPEEFEQWSIRFNRFIIASGLDEKSKEVQVNTLLYCMGKNADDIFKSFNLSAEHAKDYEIVSKWTILL